MERLSEVPPDNNATRQTEDREPLTREGERVEEASRKTQSAFTKGQNCLFKISQHLADRIPKNVGETTYDYYHRTPEDCGLLKFAGGLIGSLLLVRGFAGSSLLAPVALLGGMALWEINDLACSDGRVRTTALSEHGHLPGLRGAQASLLLLTLLGSSSRLSQGSLISPLIGTAAFIGTGLHLLNILNEHTGSTSYVNATPAKQAKKRAEFLGFSPPFSSPAPHRTDETVWTEEEG